MSGPQGETTKTKGERSEVKHTHTERERQKQTEREALVALIQLPGLLSGLILCIKTAEGILLSSRKHNSCPSIVRLLIIE